MPGIAAVDFNGLIIVVDAVGCHLFHHLTGPGVHPGHGEIFVHRMQGNPPQIVGLCPNANQKLSRIQGVAESLVGAVING